MEDRVPAELPYMPSVTNLAGILDRIKEAATPPKFTHDFLKKNLGFSSSNDRAVIKVLKVLGFLTADGTPTARYNAYRGSQGQVALAEGLRDGWKSLFLSDETIYQRTSTEILGVVKNATGAGDAVARKIASTFKTLADKADFSGPVVQTKRDEVQTEVPPPSEATTTSPPREQSGLALHHDIHLHLPPTSDVSVYRAIFQAIKSELM